MTCGSCGAVNRAGAKFCAECGAGLSLVCPNGHPVAGGARFCDECGAAMGAGTPAPSAAPAPAAERRHVSVLFADLVGFTTASEERDAEDTRELLSAYFETCRRLIDRYGGTVEKFIGDAVMAVWGAPVANEDDAAVPLDDLPGGVEVTGQELARVLCVTLLRGRGEPDEVGEEHRDQTALGLRPWGICGARLHAHDERSAALRAELRARCDVAPARRTGLRERLGEPQARVPT